MLDFWKRKQTKVVSVLLTSILHDETTFYQAFLKDLQAAKREVIIESPYITSYRMRMLYPIFAKLLHRGIKVFIITRPPQEHDSEKMRAQAEIEIRRFEQIGIQALLCVGSHHRKLAMIDRNILWEGSLNILSQSYSREYMRRIASHQITQDTFIFLKFDKIIY